MKLIALANRRLDEIEGRHPDRDTVHAINQSRQLIDDLFVLSDQSGCYPDERRLYPRLPGSHNAGSF